MFENSRWIAMSDSEIPDQPAPLLRRSFLIDKKIKKAFLNVCGLGHAVYYINGQVVSDNVLSTPFTNYDKTVLYTTFNVKNHLTKGENVIGTLLGNGCYFVTKNRWDINKPAWFHHPKMIAQLDIEFEDGTTLQVNSDRKWTANESAVLVNNTKIGEIYDARKEIDGWCLPGFDDSDWTKVFICRSPGGIMRKMKHPPIRVDKEFIPTKISDTVYDFGQNISGWVKIKGQAKRGHKITLNFGEILKEDGHPDGDRLLTICCSQFHTDTYIFRGEKVEEWAPKFAYHGFRYVEILNAPKDLEVIGQFIHTDVPVIGSFECSDETLNKIHHMTKMSTLGNIQGVVTDCPQREQNAWTGDALISAEQSLFNYDMSSLYDKWFQDIRDMQRPNGQIPCISPTSGWGYNWGSGPSFDSILFILPYLVYKYTGSSSLIRKNWPNMKKYISFMETMTDDYFLDYGLGDWQAPKEAPVTPTEFTDTIFYYVDNTLMAKFAVLLGHDCSYYKSLAENIRKAFREKYVTDGIVNINTQTAVAAAIYNGILDPNEIPANAKKLNDLVASNGYHTSCGILGTKFIYSALSDNGYGETAYKMTINPTYPSYAYWVSQGMTTLCEAWDLTDSLNHHMFSEVDTFFYKYLAGIRLNAGKVTIKPLFLEGLDYVKANHRNIKVYWDKKVFKIDSDKDFTLILNDKEMFYKKGSYTFNI